MLPEYISVVCISLAVTWVFVAIPIKGRPPAMQSPWLIPATACYILVIGCLIAETFRHRGRFTQIVLDHANGEFILEHGTEVIDGKIVERVDEHLGRFFGRRAHVLNLSLHDGRIIEITEALFGYLDLKFLLQQLGVKTTNAFDTQAMERHMAVGLLSCLPGL